MVTRRVFPTLISVLELENLPKSPKKKQGDVFCLLFCFCFFLYSKTHGSQGRFRVIGEEWGGVGVGGVAET